jgi:hypothetical protein
LITNSQEASRQGCMSEEKLTIQTGERNLNLFQRK